MLQLVCIKQVANTETRIKVAADGTTLDPSGVTWVLNVYDEFAVEEALRLKEALGAGEVVLASVGGAGVTTTLRNALAMGADRAVHLKTDDPAPDGLQVARALSALVTELQPGLVWMGKQAVDDDASAVGPMVAEMCGMPCVTVVCKAAIEGGVARLEREIEGGRELVEVPLPAVLTADKGLNEPRHASLKGIMAAKKKPIDERPAALGAPGLERLALELPPPRAAGRIVGEGVAAVPALVQALRDEAKVL